MENFQNALKDLINYVKTEVVNGNYTFVKSDEYTATLLLEKDLIVEVWIANTPYDDFSIYQIEYKNLKLQGHSIQFFAFNKTIDRVKAWDLLRNLIKKEEKKRLEKQLLEIQNKLK